MIPATLLLGWAVVVGPVMRRAAGGLAASLMFARWCRSRALRSWVPHTRIGVGSGGQSVFGDRCCCGGCPAHHRGVLAHVQPGALSESNEVISRGHFGPDEPGELAGDSGDDHFADRLAGVETTELAG